MRTCTLVVAALALAASAPSAQTGNALVSAEADTVHSFQIRDGQIYLDGRHLPGAVPVGLDLTGYDGELTYRIMPR